VYLTLTTVAKFLPDINVRAREGLQQWVLDPSTNASTAWPLLLRAIVTGVHSATDEWGRQRDSTSWKRQRLLCLTAVALILTGRERLLRPDSRTWFFWLAVRAATQLLPPNLPSAFENPEPIWLRQQLIPGEVISLLDRLAPVPPVPEPEFTSPLSEEAEVWTEFVAELRIARLDAPDQAFLAARTETLRSLLTRALSITAGEEDETNEYLHELESTLEEGLRPGASNTDVQAAAEQARLLRSWILDQLA
jgi:hypothetical protein